MLYDITHQYITIQVAGARFGGMLQNEKYHPHTFNVDATELIFAAHSLKTIQILIRNNHRKLLPQNSVKLCFKIGNPISKLLSWILDDK